MKQNRVKIYAQALCCALAVCSASDFACGMNVMDVKQEKVKDISAETAISCMQDIDKAASVVWELHNKDGTISENDVYAAFEKVGISQDEVILDPSELTVPPSGTSFVWISEGRISTLAMYLCSRIYMDLPFENKFTEAVSYKFDQYGKGYGEYSNYEACLSVLNAIGNLFYDTSSFYNFYLFFFGEFSSDSDNLESFLEGLYMKWKKYATYCDNKEITRWTAN